MDWEFLMWLWTLLLTAGLIFVAVFTLMSYSDLESDYVNPIDLTRRVNTMVLPEMVGQAVLTALLFLSGNWLEVALNIPLLGWNIYRTVFKRNYYLDPTQIFRTVPYHRRVGFVKLGFYMLTFFFYLYKMVYYLVKTYISTNNKMKRVY